MPAVTKKSKVIIRYPNQSGAVVQIVSEVVTGSRPLMLFGAECTACLDFRRPWMRTRIAPVRRWATEHAATCRALPQPEADHQ
jgi:hypothetical protein